LPTDIGQDDLISGEAMDQWVVNKRRGIAAFMHLAAHLISRDEAPASIERGGRKAHTMRS
jgi:hypothetical protein